MASNKRTVVAALLVLLVGVRLQAQTAPVFNAAATGVSDSGGTTVTTSTSITVSGTNRYLMCAVTSPDSDYSPANATDMTFAGSYPLTIEGSWYQLSEAGVGTRTDVYHLIAPPLVSGTVSANLNIAKHAAILCLLYNYVDQTTPHGTVGFDGARNTQTNITLTGTTSSQVVVDFTGFNLASTCGIGIFANGTPATNLELAQVHGTATPDCVGLHASWQPGGPASVSNRWFTWDGTNTMTVSWTALGIPLNFSSAGGGGTPGRKMLLLGVGGHP